MNISCKTRSVFLLFFLINFHDNLCAQLVGFAVEGGLVGAVIESSYGKGGESYGLNGGIKFDFHLTATDDGLHHVRFSPAVSIRQAGSNEFVTNANLLDYSRVDLTYLGVLLPLTLAIVNEEFRPTGFMLQFGTFIGCLVSENVELGSSRVNSFKTTKDRIDFGLNINVQFHYGDNGTLVVGFNHGVNNITFVNDRFDPVIGKNRGFFVNYSVALDFSSTH